MLRGFVLDGDVLGDEGGSVGGGGCQGGGLSRCCSLGQLRFHDLRHGG